MYEARGGLQLWDKAGLVQGPGCLVFAGGGKPNSKVIAAVAPVQLVEPVPCADAAHLKQAHGRHVW